jgi:hypothetical protein
MNDLFKLMPFICSYPLWVKWSFVVWVLLSAALVAILVFVPRNQVTDPMQRIEQSASVKGQNNTTVQVNKTSAENMAVGTGNIAVKMDRVSIENLIINNPPQSKNIISAPLASSKNKEIQLNLPKAEYDLTITGRSRIDTRVISPDESQNFKMNLQEVDRYIKKIKVTNKYTNESTVFDFTSGHLPKDIEFKRYSGAYYPEINECNPRLAEDNEPRFVRINDSEYALYVESSSTNYLLNSSDPQKHYTSLESGTYTFWFYGTGTVSLIVLPEKKGWTVFPSKPHTFVVNSEGRFTLGIIPDGDIKCYQLEMGEEATSVIKTENATVTRAGEVVSYNPKIFGAINNKQVISQINIAQE